MKDASKHPLQEMFTELLNGVEYKVLEECCQIWDNKRKPITKGARVAGEYPYYGANGVQDYVADYIFDGKYVLVGEDGSVITPSGTPVVNWAEGKIWVNNHAHIISEKEGILLRYLFHYLQTINITPLIHGNIPKLTGGDFRALNIPVPPLPVQEEIVRILDNFTELQEGLQAELQARQQQYEYYQDLLLNKSQYPKHITIGELCVVNKGNTPIQKAIEGKYPLVVTTVKRKSCDRFQFDANAVCIPLVSSRGHGVASLNHIYYQEGKFALGNILCAVIPNDECVIKAKYLYYYLEYAKDYTLVPLMKGGANVSLHCSDIEKVKIPLPTLSEQERIISILDRFDAFVNDQSQGLPAEIEARRKQYEYYRDRLLRFKRM